LTSNGLLKDILCFDKLSMNGKLPVISGGVPFALGLSKDEGRVSQVTGER
jgi:hypothetical protein